jgi:hypothetical protein
LVERVVKSASGPVRREVSGGEEGPRIALKMEF